MVVKQLQQVVLKWLVDGLHPAQVFLPWSGQVGATIGVCAVHALHCLYDYGIMHELFVRYHQATLLFCIIILHSCMFLCVALIVPNVVLCWQHLCAAQMVDHSYHSLVSMWLS